MDPDRHEKRGPDHTAGGHLPPLHAGRDGTKTRLTPVSQSTVRIWLLVLNPDCLICLFLQNYTKAMRLFVGEPVWKAYNRPADDFEIRQRYMASLQGS